MKSFEDRVAEKKQWIEDATRNKQWKRLKFLANFNLNWAVSFRGICQTQDQIIKDLKAQLEKKQVCESCELVESLQGQLASSKRHIESILQERDTWMFRYQLVTTAGNTFRNAAIEEIVNTEARYRSVRAQLKEMKEMAESKENANNPQETAD